MTSQRLGDAMEVAPDLHESLLENERIRVLKYRMKPGDRAELHSHPDGVVYHLEGNLKARSVNQDGQAQEYDLAPGMCVWTPASSHVFEGVSGEEGIGLIIELR